MFDPTLLRDSIDAGSRVHGEFGDDKKFTGMNIVNRGLILQ